MSLLGLTIQKALLLSAFILLGVATEPVFAKKSVSSQKCGKKELELKNCKLNFKNYSLAFWKEKFSVSNGISRSLTDIPLVQEKVNWDSVQVLELAGALFVEFIAWQEPDATEIQTKMWYVYALENEKAILKIEKSLYKRLLIENSKVKSDRAKKFGLKVENKKVYWFYDREKGLLQ